VRDPTANRHGKPRTFRKTKFSVDGAEYELDAAAYASEAIEVGIDVKRIEARRDIHKRCDEIVNKAAKFKKLYPSGFFGSVVYYPFPEGQVNIQTRLESPSIAGVVFANDEEEVVDAAVRILLEKMGVAAPIPLSGTP
jgi:hypothetical protein